MPRILIVEDEQDLASLLEYNLKNDGFEVEVARTGAAGVTRARSFKPDLVLLDLMLPDIAGTEVARLLRESEGKRVSIIMVTARGEESDRVKGLELGADDYVVKPFSVKELLLRIRNVLRREASEPPGPLAGALKAADIALDAERHEVTVLGRPVVLTALEFRLLKTFLERPGRVQTRETLLSDVWGIDAEITTRTVDTHIKRLREKLGPSGDVIETIRGVGYKLVTPGR
ncbi:MAG: response regulator transcription factor [Myxococcaceae bacterium]|jgi:two-component system phosphate regulon response regulator PhoB|nr:response regulator transcription factor [Myxococcaceae bacterium]MCA3015020.1 response regulator transcription factor [Myxococcaceae bacterium]